MVKGLELPNGCLISHGEQGSTVKRPFDFIPGLVMNELSAGSPHQNATVCDNTKVAASFHGQLGIIPFTTTHRLPRHVHIAESPGDPNKKILVTERILVLNGVALVELNGKIYIIPPGALVTIAPGVPHTWNACPAGIKLPDGATSDGTFLMVYEYESPTGFFPTAQVETLNDVSMYVKFEGALETIRFPELTAEEVVEQGTVIWGTEQCRANLA